MLSACRGRASKASLRLTSAVSGACLEAQQLLQLIGLPPRTRCAMLPQRLRLVLALALLVCAAALPAPAPATFAGVFPSTLRAPQQSRQENLLPSWCVSASRAAL